MDIITVQNRNENLKAKQLRRQGIVPGCVYGGNLKESISIQMGQTTADKLLRELRLGSKIQLKLNDQVITTQIKESTRCFENNKLEHISFEALNPETKVNSVAHVILKNDSKTKGILDRRLLEIPYASLPKDMIDTVSIDLEDKEVGTVVTVGDIPEFVNDNIELQVEKDSIIYKIDERRSLASQDTEEADE
ncbi:large subunit ribosomal protein L25 [Hathewaya proteolytica DSM 3090]|uniref:Large subunit ribosomal protein L25 n=1 Tax=Hathewaya proteolytica DSM 3090 TaxID=1121331 RepID=A0A1M6N460_9CLOT|nr:5S rRNA E-loop-binding protein [Hathewaya proteolytica]SHJ90489.1 large subunit ribosomal protein L25 [Hathewaya proteolytica DSM 3090]